MSGHCDWCGVWHSGSCCHPGRQIYEMRERRIAELEAALAECEARGICWPCGVVDSRTHQCATYQGEGLADGFAKAIKIESDKGHAALVELSERMAECEREKERISLQYGANLPATCDWGNCDEKATGFRYDDAGHGWLPICDKHNPLVADLSRKLAAARECRQAENSDDRPRGWQDWCITHSQSVWRCLAALTEAGEGRNDADIR